MPLESESDREIRRRALRETMAIALATFLITGAGIVGVWVAASQAIQRGQRDHLKNLALVAALQVDADLHRRINHPDQINDPDYQDAIAPLRRMRLALPEVRRVFTMTQGSDGRMHYVLDDSAPVDEDGDGVQDQAQVWQVFEAMDTATRESLGDGESTGRASATRKPTVDVAGSLMTGMAPLLDDSGDQYGIIAVAIESNRFVAQLRETRFWSVVGLLPAALLTLLFGMTYFRVRQRGLHAALEARRNAEVLHIEREHLASVVEGTKAGTWEAVVDPELASRYVITVDACWAELLGRPLEELNPLTPERLFPLLVHPDDVATARDAIDNALREDGPMFSTDLRMRHSDGRWIWLEVRGKVIQRDARGRPLRMVGTQIDVSARKEAELALQKSEGDLRALFEGAPIGICLFEMASGRFLKVNNALAESTGYSREQLLRMTYWDITPSEYHVAGRTETGRQGEGTTFGPYELEYQRPDGTRFPVLVSGSYHADAFGHEIGWAIVQDISARKAAEEALAQATMPKIAAP